MKYKTYKTMLKAVKRIRELHTKEHYEIPGCSEPGCCGDGWEGYQCSHCGSDWPCDTIRVLDGEEV